MAAMIAPLRRYADFTGRSGRTEFWTFFLFPLIVMAGFGVWFLRILVAIGAAGPSDHLVDDAAADLNHLLAAVGIFVALTFIPSLAVQVRRFHDQDKPGALVLNFIPAVGTLIVLAFMCAEGTQGPNRYGPPPVTSAGSSPS